MLHLISILLPLLFTVSGLLKTGSEQRHNSSESHSNPAIFSTVPTDLIIVSDENTAALEKRIIPWLLHFTNQYRKANGLDTLKYDECLLKSASYHSTYLIRESQENQQFKLDHHEEEKSKWFKGKTPSDRAAAAGCQKYCGENALYMTVSEMTSEEFSNDQVLDENARKLAKVMVYEHWHKSKAHRENMLNPTYTSIGVAVAIGKTNSSNSYNINEHLPSKLVAFGVQVFAF